MQAVDCLLDKWDAAYRNLEMAEARLAQAKDGKRPTHRLGCCGCRGETERERPRCREVLNICNFWQWLRASKLSVGAEQE